MPPSDARAGDPRWTDVVGEITAQLTLTTSWRFVGPPVLMRFPLANTSYEVRHLLGDVPDGFVVIDTDARIKRTPGVAYTKELAFLQADMANATAVLAFGVLRETIVNVNAT